MIVWLRHFLGWVVSAFRSREDLVLENVALGQQLLAFRAKRPHRRLIAARKLFWVVLRKVWAEWRKLLILVTPRTVVQVASCWLSTSLEMVFASPIEGRSKACKQRSSSVDLPNGR